MINTAVFNKLRIGAITLAARLALSTTTIAQAHGGGHGGGAYGAGGANENYYQWNGAVSLYETVRPPRGLASQVATTQASVNFNLSDFNLFAYPKNAQTTEQLATDRSECQPWATDQTGINPPQGDSEATVAASPAERQDFLRAQSACLEGRGYSVK